MGNAKLTDKQIQKICADYVLNESISETARVNNVSYKTVKKYIQQNPTVVKNFQAKKEETCMSMEEYIRSKTELAQQIVNRYMMALLDEEKIERATSSQLTTAMGTVIDKFLLVSKNDGSTVEDLTPIARMLNDDSNTDN